MFKPKEGEIPKNLWGWKWVLIGGIFVASIAGLFIYRIQGVGPDAKIWPTQDESQFKLETEHQRKARERAKEKAIQDSIKAVTNTQQ